MPLVDLPRTRSFWARRQGLANPGPGAVGATVDRAGWVRTLGGVDVYLALLARIPGLRAADVDRAAAAHEVQVVPAVRGCIYLVPRADVPMALRLAEAEWRPRSDRDLAKAGVPQQEVADLATEVAKALAKGPLSTDALRKALPPGAVRSLGPEAKKIGLSSALPVALRWLELEGRVERTLPDGRLDSERYLWRLAAEPLPAAPPDLHAAFLSGFLRRHGPASVDEIAGFSALSKKEIKAALARVPAVPVTIEGHAPEAWLLEDDVPALQDAAPIASDSVAVLPFEDSAVVVHGPGAITEARHHGLEVRQWGNQRPATLGEAKHVHARVFLAGGRLAGFWEYDLRAGRPVWKGLDPLPDAILGALESRADGVTRLVADLGNAKSYSLDTDEAIQERADALRR
jgi:hypothetical protein